jgi:drug/metabolite transporter (DMT)-like permease
MARIKLVTPIGASLIVLSSVFYASYGIWTKLMGNSFGGYSASAWRSLVVLLLLVPIAAAYRQFEPLGWARNWRQLLGLVVGSLVIWGPLYYAILHAGIGISLAVSYAFIVIGMFIFGRVLAGESFSRDKQLSTLLGLVGVALVYATNLSYISWITIAAAIISGLGSASNMVITKLIPYNATQSTVVLWGASVIANFLMVAVTREHSPAANLNLAWLYLFVFAGASVAASWLFVKGVKLVDAGAAGILGLLEIVFGVLFGSLLFSERPGVLTLIGVAIIIAAAAIPYFKDYRAKPGAP